MIAERGGSFLDPAHRAAAARRSVEIRQARARLKSQMKASRLSLADFLEAGKIPAPMAKMLVLDALRFEYHVAGATARRIAVSIPAHRRLDQLTHDEGQLLVRRLRERQVRLASYRHEMAA